MVWINESKRSIRTHRRHTTVKILRCTEHRIIGKKLFFVKKENKFPIIMSLTLNHYYNVNIFYSVACRAIKLNSWTEKTEKKMCEIYSQFSMKILLEKFWLLHFTSELFDSKRYYIQCFQLQLHAILFIVSISNNKIYNRKMCVPVCVYNNTHQKTPEIMTNNTGMFIFRG